mmetsp:Transcript_59002/g.133626  ORF Transcript_59002/g.133626 Transcript_59002/m.133626 type:complete len:342 (-) Transcript_59002:702-1727(-)
MISCAARSALRSPPRRALCCATTSTASWEDMTPNTPSLQARKNSSRPSTITCSLISGFAITPLFLKARSPSDRLMASPQVMSRSSQTLASASSSSCATQPPAFSMRWRSPGSSGVWSVVRSTATSAPFRGPLLPSLFRVARTIRESPQLASVHFPPCTSIAVAVVPPSVPQSECLLATRSLARKKAFSSVGPGAVLKSAVPHTSSTILLRQYLEVRCPSSPWPSITATRKQLAFPLTGHTTHPASWFVLGVTQLVLEKGAGSHPWHVTDPTAVAGKGEVGTWAKAFRQAPTSTKAPLGRWPLEAGRPSGAGGCPIFSAACVAAAAWREVTERKGAGRAPSS